MIKTLSPYSTSTSKAAEIMSRYRPIAPKPEHPTNSTTEDMAMSPRIRQSPYLRNLWPQLQAKPTRTRKRGRGNLSVSPISFKKERAIALNFSPVKNLCMQGFVLRGPPRALNLGCLDNSVASVSANLVTLPLLPSANNPRVSAAMPENYPKAREEKKASWDIDLNTVAEIPEEDLLLQLQGPSTYKVLKPHAIKPVSSSITVGCILEETRLNQTVQVFQKAEEVEELIEVYNFPIVLTDSNNNVRMANSAYREMVGEPKCSWLKSLVSWDESSVECTCKRICGQVSLNCSCPEFPFWSIGFSCWVNIEWEKDGIKRSVHAPSDVTKIACKSKDYVFIWKFHAQYEKPPQSSSSV